MGTDCYVGIDLGTTNSCACTSDGSRTAVVRSARGGHLTPSVVRIDARGNTLCGERARRYLETDPENTRTEFKRLMGTQNTLSFAAAKLEKRPEELAAVVLEALRADIELAIGYRPRQAVITVPALFELPQSRATADAARLAGFERVELLQEPVASALATGWSNAGGKPWLIYDLGGGTFDVSLLEPQEGLLRVVGHDGDNFLGGRDIDAALLNHVLATLAKEDVTIDRKDPSIAAGLRQLRAVCEEAKVDASLSGGDVLVSALGLKLGREPIDVDVAVPRADFDTMVLEVVDATLEVCVRLLARHGMHSSQLERVVLVGGPTMMPLLRQRIAGQLGIVVDTARDPMTLVAEGAALFAATSGLQAAPPAAGEPAGPGVQAWLQFPAVTPDLGPYVVGKIVSTEDRARVTGVVFRREGGEWESKIEPIDSEGAFAVALSLQPRALSRFFGFAVTDGKRIALAPSTFTIHHGVTIGDPPLSRSIGIALEDGAVHTYFERGVPLPTRRTYSLGTATPIGPSLPESRLRIPIVQGEFPFAHLCRQVGALEIAGVDLPHAVSPGTRVEIVLSLDAAGALHAQAKLDTVERIFDDVAHLVAPALSATELREASSKMRDRFVDLYATAGEGLRARMHKLDKSLAETDAWADAGEGGDADALEKARRRLLELEASLHEIESERAWPELEAECREEAQWAVVWVGETGTDAERASLEQGIEALRQALHARDAAGVKRQLGFIKQLRNLCYFRAPGSWEGELEYRAARVEEAYDVRKATAIVDEGRRAVAKGDREGVQNAVIALDRLLPSDPIDRARGLGSGVRRQRT
ncbi:MAG TPA: Hsp70 family protein [Polyangiaceae bacterium]|nr:Hsp70 family protein [Polyangiaceae bacterium]